MYCADGCDRVAVLSINVKGKSPELVGKFLANEKIITRVGLHCAPKVHESIGTISSGGTVRFSVGYFNTFEEVDIISEALSSLVNM
jgi:selenocysteine lyase/cysteine desulfurase